MDDNEETRASVEAAELCLQWHRHHDTLVSILDTLWERQELVDVTLTAQGQSINVHRIILCACSQYFQGILTQREYIDKQAIIFLKDVDFCDLEALVHYMYKGEVRITEDKLSSFLATAKSLGIRGLVNSGPLKGTEEAHFGDTAASKECEKNISKNIALPLPPPLKHMASLTKRQDAPLVESELVESPESSAEEAHNSDFGWQETAEELEDADEPVPQDPANRGTSANWIQDQSDINPAAGKSGEETVWTAATSSDDSTALYSLLLQNCSTSDEGPGISSAAQEASNDSLIDEELADINQEEQIESSDQEMASNEHLDQLATQAIVPNRRSSKKESVSRRPLYSCNRCGRVYSKKHSVLRHLRYECGVEPQFQCSICNQRFKHRSDQQRHERKIHGVEPASYDDDGGGGEISDNM